MDEGREEVGAPAASWRLYVSDFQQMPERPKEPPFVTRVFLRSHGMYGTPLPLRLHAASCIVNCHHSVQKSFLARRCIGS